MKYTEFRDEFLYLVETYIVSESEMINAWDESSDSEDGNTRYYDECAHALGAAEFALSELFHNNKQFTSNLISEYDEILKSDYTATHLIHREIIENIANFGLN